MGCGCKTPEWITGSRFTKAGLIPVVSTELTGKDKRGEIMVRLGIKRMHYTVAPGIYAVGTPGENSDVFVTANYKLTFDMLRGELHGLSAWILVLDTCGINVWCAAGKGTFGTGELIARIAKVRLKEIVSHNRLILPQLGAVGVSAHTVTRETGFKVLYGPVRASDIPAYIADNYQKAPQMREVTFSFSDRLELTPLEIVISLKYCLIAVVLIVVANLLRYQRFDLSLFNGVLPFIGAVLTGAFLVPLLLPLIPFRAFSLKGFALGLAGTIALIVLSRAGLADSIIYLCFLPAISSFFAMNFTGSSTFTSMAGVKLEVGIATPLIIISVAGGVVMELLKTLRVI
ncbi:MAG: acetyl-CoA synthase subunit gamma [Brevinematales bacterium]|nr:acetyl-CoA synthase subunit gamma [Brevinematales bacterium]